MSQTRHSAILARVSSGELSADAAYALLTAPAEILEPATLLAAPAVDPVLPAASAILAVEPLLATTDDDRLHARLENRLRDVVAAEAQIPVARVAAGEPLERYGFDSVMALNVTRTLQADFGELPPTLLFEHQTVASLASYLAGRHPDRVRALFPAAQPAAEPARRAASLEAPRTEAPRTEAPRTEAPRRTPRPEPRSGEPRPARSGTIAIVGMSGRFPMADDLDALWANLAAGRDCITEVPAERWDHSRYFDPTVGRAGKSYSRWGGFLDGVDRFDAAFFNISPREAERMDPQERLFLMEAWRALENAGMPRDRVAGRSVGVYVGVMYSQYQLFAAEEALRGNPLTLGASYATIANRLSYLLDLRGPSMAVDSMCSSSLTAIHLACEAIRGGTVEAAVAGGVNLSVHPAKYVDLSRDRYASTDGRCRSFGAGGDGYVPGEGVGAVVLKPLAAAEADGDRILAVIRGSALNHGGKTNGYSVPNPVAQGRVIADALSAAGVEPRQVGYLEAHGTGTGLGDPIEVAGLAAAFEGVEPGSCALGSVKSNVGHLEAAAGIAGLAKVVLQMREGTIAPSLHADPANPHIDFAPTPFRVQREAAPWARRTGPDGAPAPRVAGISSFGAGGANAHLVIEEYLAPAAAPLADEGGALIVLSAKTDERLRALAGVMAARLARLDALPEHELLARAAFTLQVGRQPLEERLALWVTSRAGLVDALAAFADGATPAGLLRGTVGDEHGGIEALLRGRAGASFVSGLVEARDHERLAQLWLHGVGVDWRALAPDPAPRLLDLPGYPFAQDRHWAPTGEVGARAERPLHPLVGRNVSTLREQRFVTRLDGTEPLLRDHRVGGRVVVPAAALLEMVRAAGVLGGLDAEPRIVDTRWERPVVLDAPLDLAVTLAPDADGVAYRVWSGDEVHARGRLVSASARPESLDLAGLEARCGRVMDADECYGELAARGMVYGPLYRTVQRVARGRGECLGTLRLAGPADAELVIHPALLDGALHMLAALAGSADEGAWVPSSLAALEIFGALPAVCRVHAVLRSESAAERTFDLTVADEAGRVVASLRGLAARPLPRANGASTLTLRPVWTPAAAPAASGKPASAIVLEDDAATGDLLVRALGPGVRVLRVSAGSAYAERDGRVVMRAGEPEDYARMLEGFGALPELIVHAWSRAGELDAALETGFYTQLFLAQALMKRRPDAPVRVVCVHPAGEPAFAAAGGLHRTIQRESPALRFSAAELPVDANGVCVWSASAAGRVLAEYSAPGGERVRWEGAARLRRTLESVDSMAGAAPLKRGGVYLLTGGLGGVGRIVARHLARSYGARLLLAGRSEIGAEGESFLRALAGDGGDARYLRADCGVAADAVRMVEEARRAFGRLDGVLHFAGTLRDGLVLRKERGDARAVLAPKVYGAANLDEATRHEPLDFFALASSVTAWMGTAGQADYAFANAFTDEFAARREEARLNGTRSGRTVSVAWPLWDGGGMGVDDAARASIEARYGWVPLPGGEGVRVLEAALASQDACWSVFHGHRAKIEATMGLDAARAGEARADAPAPAAASARLLEGLRVRLADELKLPVERVRGGDRFERLGIDSVMVMNLTAELETVFGDLPKTLFFEFETLDALCAHLAQRYPAALESGFGSDTESGRTDPESGRTDPVPYAPPVRVPGAEYVTGPNTGAINRAHTNPEPAGHTVAAAAPANRILAVTSQSGGPIGRFLATTPAGETSRFPASPAPATDEPIAIVGVAGRYPMADTLDELWANLREGRDCITEVPAGRWSDETPNRWGGFLRDVDRFDPLFFNISPREARMMDPQERLFLQTAWQTLEDAGYTPDALRGSAVGVFVGVMYNQYQLHGASAAMQARGFVPSSLASSIANRVSFALDFNGPSIAVDTMCSSSLTALHLACGALRGGDCEVALAGGVNLTLHPNKYHQLSLASFASSDGRCRSFGEGGDGYVPGEGVGAVLLKPLSRARADGDHVYAVIRGTAVNHGGRTNGYTVPTPVAQGAVIRRALDRAGVKPHEIGYVEAHGTGTSLGDPIEIAGLERAFTAGGEAPLPHASCPAGSIKSAIGHLESAAGIAGITKVLLQMKHRELAPSLHAERLNPNIRFDQSPFYVQRQAAPWSARVEDGRELPRIAVVSSFGAGGSNAHVVLEEEIAPVSEPVGAAPELIVLSARTADRLVAAAEALAARLEQHAAPLGAVVASLARLVAEVAGVDEADVSAEDELEGLGLDPVALATLGDRILATHSVALDARDLAGCRTLREVAERVARGAPARGGLRDVAFTLQTGREPLDERLALVAGDAAELAARLRRFAAGGDARAHRGRASADAVPAEIHDGEAGLERLARAWADGSDVDWSRLPREAGARRVPLPVYPFAGDRFWVPEEAAMVAPRLEMSPAEPPSEPVLYAVLTEPNKTLPITPPHAHVAEQLPPIFIEPAQPHLPAAIAQAHQQASAPSHIAPDMRWERACDAVIDAEATVLEIPRAELDLDLPHSDFGVDSVLVVEIVDRINETLGSDLKPTDFFNYSTIRKLAAHLVAEGIGFDAPPALVIDTAPLDVASLLARLRAGEIGAAEADRLLAGAA